MRSKGTKRSSYGEKVAAGRVFRYSPEYRSWHKAAKASAPDDVLEELDAEWRRRSEREHQRAA